MNPFVNPKKRGVTLPKWCKNLLDVLKHPRPELDEPVRRFIHLLLLQTQQDRGTKLVIGVASNEETPIRYKVGDTWRNLPPFPSRYRARVISELARMANFPEGQISGKGILNENLGTIQLRWAVTITSAEEECILSRLQN